MPREDPESRAAMTVVMPTFEQSAFLRRALDSLLSQSFGAWRLIVVDDASRDATPAILAELAGDPRVELVTLPENVGLGAALNIGLDLVATELVAYLPSDDVYQRDHLASLVHVLEQRPDAVLAYAGLRHSYNRTSLEPIGGWLQLVQVAHRLTDDRWIEREELVTDDLDRMFWSRLARRGPFAGTGAVSCEWVDHPDQLTKLVREPIGGINPYRQRFEVRHPLRFHTSVGNRIDEVEHYRAFRQRPDTPPALDGLRVLLVGELSYNPERVLALEERGHRLWGLWTDRPYWYTAVGPQPFGHVVDVPRTGWQNAVRAIRPDVVYALLNWQAVPFAAAVRRELAGEVPFVWHFKEGPFICLERGTWPDLVELIERADGLIHSSEEMGEWFRTVVPNRRDRATELVLDGDLPKADWFAASPGPRLSAADGEIHTVVPGRPIGLHPETVAELAAHGIHLHFYGDFTHGQWLQWIERARGLAPRHLHLHANVDQDRWVDEFSRYDAGWLHVFRSRNGGDIRAADWDDLNLPARMATLAAAGLPMIQGDNLGSIVATQTLTRRLDVGVFFAEITELGEQLRDAARIEQIRANVWRVRDQFTFDRHADGLVGFLRSVIERAGGASEGMLASVARTT